MHYSLNKCTRTQNAHLHKINSGFSVFVRLKLTLVIQLLKVVVCLTILGNLGSLGSAGTIFFR